MSDHLHRRVPPHAQPVQLPSDAHLRVLCPACMLARRPDSVIDTRSAGQALMADRVVYWPDMACGECGHHWTLRAPLQLGVDADFVFG